MSNNNEQNIANTSFDSELRPNVWEDYIGQERVKENLQILLRAAKERGHAPEHVLFYGPPGLGKTTLAYLISKELGVNLRITSGPAIDKVGDLASILTNLTKGDILFIDEIHRLKKSIEEILYPAMESGVLDIVIGKGASARTLQLELEPFTLVAATTQTSMISGPLRSRFSGGVFRLRYYSNEELSRILSRNAVILGVDTKKDALFEIARRSRATPRIANYLLKRCRDYAQVNGKVLSVEVVKEALSKMAIDELGLTEQDRMLLDALVNKFGGGPTGLKTLAAAIGETEDTIENVQEPFLIQLGLIERTPRGRVATAFAREHIKNSIYDI